MDKLPEYYIIELIEDVDYKINEKIHLKGERKLVYLAENFNFYIVANSEMEIIPIKAAKIIYELELKEVTECVG